VILSLLAGLALLTGVVALVGYRPALKAIAAVGVGGFAAYTLYWPPVIAVLGLAWYAVSPGLAPAKLGLLTWARLLRDAASDILPFAQLSGFLVGARAAQAGGAPGDLVAAATIADATAEMAAQALYTLMGVAFLLAGLRGEPQSASLAWPAVAAFGFLVAAVATFWMLQRRGVSVVGRLAARWAPGSAEAARAIRDRLDDIYRRPGRLALSAALHLVGWAASGVGTWIALTFMGAHAALRAVRAIESVMYAARSVAFVLPGGLGVQEGAYVLLGPLFGLSPGDMLAVSLLRRARDLVIGVPALLIWQAQEGRTLLASDA
jgi:putative membrane protein